jgi:hypothetical protein
MNKKTKLAVSSVTAGIAALGAAGAMLLGALPGNAATTDAKTVAASNASALKPSSLSFVASRWDCTQGSYFNSKNCHFGAMVPKGWKATKVGAHDAKFAVGTDFLRVADGPQQLTTAKAIAGKKASLKGTRDLKVLGMVNTTATTGGKSYSTIVYTYTDAAKTTRWVATRFLDPSGYNGRSAAIELTVGGPVQDKTALTNVLARATTSAYLAG